MIIGNKIFHKKRVYNSIEWAKSQISTAPDGAVFLADVHEYTRGRQDRIWVRYPGQLLVTVLLKPKILNQIAQQDLELRLNQLNMAVCLGILEPLKSYGIVLKWPNDFVFACDPKPPPPTKPLQRPDRRRIISKKVGGMIFDLVWQADSLLGIIIGFALNVNSIISESDKIYKIATSIKTILNKEIDEKELLKNLLASLDKFYQKWLNFEFDQIYDLWKKEQFYLGKNIKVHKKDETLVQGIFQDVLPNGDLILEEQGGRKGKISFYVVENLYV